MSRDGGGRDGGRPRARTSARRRRLSPRRVRALVTIGQCWTDPDGRSWRVVQVWRVDGQALLAAGEGHELRRVGFAALGAFSAPVGGS